jgi:hypothetical protein
MGRTIPSIRLALAIEEEAEWKKPFRNALDKLDRKKLLIRSLTSYPAIDGRRQQARKKWNWLLLFCVCVSVVVYVCAILFYLEWKHSPFEALNATIPIHL